MFFRLPPPEKCYIRPLHSRVHSLGGRLHSGITGFPFFLSFLLSTFAFSYDRIQPATLAVSDHTDSPYSSRVDVLLSILYAQNVSGCCLFYHMTLKIELEFLAGWICTTIKKGNSCLTYRNIRRLKIFTEVAQVKCSCSSILARKATKCFTFNCAQVLI